MTLESLLTNGHTEPTIIPRPISAGVWAPLPAFFLPGSQDLDIPTYQRHAVKLASAGMGLVVSGSMGEAHHLSPSERITLITAAREALDSASPSLAHVPLIVGTGAGSTRETIQLTQEAAKAGADYAIVITSGYFAGALPRPAIKQFFSDVASSSPLPLVIYNYPGASGGIDMESDLIEELAAEHANIIGVKLTCGNVGKLTRIAATTSDPAWIKAHPRTIDAPFLTLGGFIDFLLPSAYANSAGAITGLGNLAPNAIVALSHLTLATLPPSALFHAPLPSSFSVLSSLSESPAALLVEAQRLQGIIARADRTVALLAGIGGTKWLLQYWHGREAYPEGSECPRLPLLRMDDTIGKKIAGHPDVLAMLVEEKKWKGVVAAKSA
ncbi:aldolase [Clavulina sp. PMI_390]|nr:aldolase [Clavulina sp. PMI_390]